MGRQRLKEGYGVKSHGMRNDETNLQTQRWIDRIRYASMPRYFSLTPLQDSFIIFQRVWGLSVYTSPCGECTGSLITQSFGNDRDCIFFFDPATRFLHHLPAGLGTTLCTMHVAVHVLFCSSRCFNFVKSPPMPCPDDHVVRSITIDT